MDDPRESYFRFWVNGQKFFDYTWHMTETHIFQTRKRSLSECREARDAFLKVHRVAEGASV